MKALFISPMIPSLNIKVTGKFFTDILGFSTVMDAMEYAIFMKDNLSVHVLRAGSDIGQMEFYMEVADIDLLWNSIKEKITALKHKEPFNRDYRMREIHIEIPQTKTLLIIGQALAI